MSNDFLPAASWDRLRARAALLKRVRRFFDERGFLEVETPVLSRDVVVDRHLDPLRVTLFADPRAPDEGLTFWLQTSPEFAMKRLLAAGAPAIYQIAKAFRGGEVGRLHNPEFTMVEWYRPGDDYAAGRNLLAQLAADLLQRGDPEQLTYREAFERFAQIDPFEARIGDLVASAVQFKVLVDASEQRRFLEAGDRDAMLDLLLTQVVEPNLGKPRPSILYNYPASQSALAQVRPGNPPVAERFELYVDGIELANGYHELLDPAVLRERNRVSNQQRRVDGKFALPEESRLLAAMDRGLPACAGTALGFDRLVMVATGARSLSEVMAFPVDRA